MTEKTRVIFRKFPDGDIIALFPFEPHDYAGYMCLSYMHIGQHGGADPFYLVDRTKLAIPQEYADLKSELESIGYNLEIGKKIPRNAIDIRREKLHGL